MHGKNRIGLQYKSVNPYRPLKPAANTRTMQTYSEKKAWTMGARNDMDSSRIASYRYRCVTDDNMVIT